MTDAVAEFYKVYWNYDLEENKCLICGKTDEIHKHHIDYINDITVPLCQKCHAKIRTKSKEWKIPAPKRPEEIPCCNLEHSIKVYLNGIDEIDAKINRKKIELKIIENEKQKVEEKINFLQKDRKKLCFKLGIY